jgi:hypothetical protein
VVSTVGLGQQVPLPPGVDDYALADTDDSIIEVHGYDKQGAGFGYTHVRGLNSFIGTVSTLQAAPVIVAQRLRKGSAGSAHGVARLVADTLATVKRLRTPGAAGPTLLRADSAFYGHKVVAAARRANEIRCRATQSIRSARGMAHDIELLHPELAGQPSHIERPVQNPPAGLRVGPAEPESVHRDQPNTGLGGGDWIRGEHPRPRRTMEQEQRPAVRVAPAAVSKVPAIVQLQVGIDDRLAWHRMTIPRCFVGGNTSAFSTWQQECRRARSDRNGPPTSTKDVRRAAVRVLDVRLDVDAELGRFNTCGGDRAA